MPRFIIALPLLIALAACQRPATEQAETTYTADTAADEDAIRAFADGYEQAFAAADTSALIGMYTGDAVEIAPDGTAEPASNAVRMFLSMTPAGTTLSIDHEQTVVAASGDLAYDTGTISFTSPGADGAGTTTTQRYLVVLKKDAGQWKLAATMVSAPVGMPGAAGAAGTGGMPPVTADTAAATNP